MFILLVVHHMQHFLSLFPVRCLVASGVHTYTNTDANILTQAAANQEAFQFSLLCAARCSALPRPNAGAGGMDNR